MTSPLAGVALATKLTGELTLAPFNGAQTTTPGADGAEQSVAAVPVPVNETLCGLPDAESVTVTAPVRVPVCVGANFTMMLQLAPAFSVAGQLLLWTKSPLEAIPLSVSVDPPLLVSDTDCAVLVVPICWFPKVKLLRVGTTAGPEFVPTPTG